MATNKAYASYQEVIDLSTTDGTISIIGIHTPVGNAPSVMLGGFWRQFRYFRYKGCSLRMVNAAQLPADPLQLSYEAGETIDPRDMLNPILFHGAHGESLNEVLNTVYKASGFDWATSSMENSDFPFDIELSEQAYYSALSDPTFKKFAPQQMIRLSMYPMVHKLALSNPMLPNANAGSRGRLFDEGGTGSYEIQAADGWVLDSADSGNAVYKGEYLTMLTNGMARLGWMPTRTPRSAGAQKGPDTFVHLPKLFMGCLILPPSYKCELYFRCVITHYFEFKGFSTALTPANNQSLGPSEYYEELPVSVNPESLNTTSLEVVNAKYDVTTSGVF